MWTKFKNLELSLQVAVSVFVGLYLAVFLISPIAGALILGASVFLWAVGRICKALVTNEFTK